jgi:uncharacterized DUF497 family protein
VSPGWPPALLTVTSFGGPCYTGLVEFEWDPEKAELNFERHGVSFHEAATVFGDPLSRTASDPDHSVDEDRFVIVGLLRQGRPLIVSHAERGDRVRIISARELTGKERKTYEEGGFD